MKPIATSELNSPNKHLKKTKFILGFLLLVCLSVSIWAVILMVKAKSYKHDSEPAMLAKEEKPNVYFWHWHHGFQLGEAEIEMLRKMKAKGFFVYVGQVDVENGELKKNYSQEIGSVPSPLEIHLAYRISHRLAQNYAGIKNEKIISLISQDFTRLKQFLSSRSISVVGIQIDFDCPTRHLRKFAHFLRDLRKSLPEGTKFSATLLPTWIGKQSLKSVLEQLDFSVPQFYGLNLQKRIDEAETIISRNKFKIWLRRLDKYGRPYLIGLPTYGYCLIFDEKGNRVSITETINPEVALENHDLTCKVMPDDMEDVFEFKAERDANLRNIHISAGSTIVIRKVHPKGLRTAISWAMAEESPSNLGISLFRYPEEDERLVLSLSQIAEVLGEQPLGHDIIIGETILDSEEGLLSFSVSNNGSLDYLDISSPIVVEVKPLNFKIIGAPPSLDSRYSVQPLFGTIECSFVRCDRLILRIPYLAAGENLVIRGIRCDRLPGESEFAIIIQNDSEKKLEKRYLL